MLLQQDRPMKVAASQRFGFSPGISSVRSPLRSFPLHPPYHHHDPPPTSALMAHPSLAATVAATSVPREWVVSQFALGFLAGGLVCGTAMALVAAFFYMGAENFRRLLDFRKTVFRHVWGIFWLGLSATKATLFMDRKWNVKEAWAVLKENMRDAKRAAREGVEAIRLEAGLYAATVGKPGLVALQYSVDHLTPKFLAQIMEDSLKETLGQIQDDYIDKVELIDFDIGKKAPELLDARAYELGDNAMAFDVDVKWRSELEATMMVQTHRIKMSVPLSVRNVNFDGVIRVVLSPLTPEPPGFGAALVSLPATPTLGLDVRMAGGEITRMPWLRSEILSTLQKGIEDQFLWPRRVVIPSPRPPRNKKRVKTLLSKRELKALERDDPLLRAEQRLAVDLDGLHHVVPPREHQILATAVSSNTTHPEPLQMDLTLKDSDCLQALGDAEEDLCIIDWDSFEVTSSSPETETTTSAEKEKHAVSSSPKMSLLAQTIQDSFLSF